MIQACFLVEEDIEFLIDDTINYLNRNNILYAEIFFAPSKFILNGLSFKKIITILDKGVKKIQKSFLMYQVLI